MPDGFKLFTGLFCIKYIFVAAFDIHLLILKKVKPNEVRKKFYHLLRYLSHFYVILWPLKLKNYSLIHPNIEKLYVFFIRKKFSTEWCTFYYFVSLPCDNWHDLTIFQILILFFAYEFFSMLHIHSLTQKYVEICFEKLLIWAI